MDRGGIDDTERYRMFVRIVNYTVRGPWGKVPRELPARSALRLLPRYRVSVQCNFNIAALSVAPGC